MDAAYLAAAQKCQRRYITMIEGLDWFASALKKYEILTSEVADQISQKAQEVLSRIRAISIENQESVKEFVASLGATRKQLPSDEKLKELDGNFCINYSITEEEEERRGNFKDAQGEFYVACFGLNSASDSLQT